MMQRVIDLKPGADHWTTEFDLPVAVADAESWYYNFDVRVETSPAGLIQIDGPTSALASVQTNGENVLSLRLQGPASLPNQVQCAVFVTTRRMKYGSEDGGKVIGDPERHEIGLIYEPQVEAGEPHVEPSPELPEAAEPAIEETWDGPFDVMPLQGSAPSAPPTLLTPEMGQVAEQQTSPATSTATAQDTIQHVQNTTSNAQDTAPLWSTPSVQDTAPPAQNTAPPTPAAAPEIPYQPAVPTYEPVKPPVDNSPPPKPPLFQRAEVSADGRTISVHFSVPGKPPLTFGGAIQAPGSGGFLVEVEGGQVAVASASVQESVVTLRLPSVIYNGKKVHLTYDASGKLRDSAPRMGSVEVIRRASVTNGSRREPEATGYAVLPSPPPGGTWPSDKVILLSLKLEGGSLLSEDLELTITPGAGLRGSLALADPNSNLRDVIQIKNAQSNAEAGPYVVTVPKGSYARAEDIRLAFTPSASLTEEVKNGSLTFTHTGGGNSFAAEGDPNPLTYNFVGSSRQVVVIRALPDDFQLETNASLYLWPCKPERVVFEIINESKNQQKFALDIRTLTVDRQGGQTEPPQLEAKTSSNDSFIPPGDTGTEQRGYYPVYLTASRQFPAGSRFLYVKITPEVGDPRTLKLPIRIKAAPAVSLEAETLPQQRRLEEAPTRWCFATRNQYRLTLANVGNVNTAVRLEVLPKPGKAVYDYIFDSRLVNLEAGAQQTVNLQVYHRETLGGIFSKQDFTVRAVPVTDETNYAPDATWSPDTKSEPVVNTKLLQTVKWQIPLWTLFLLLLLLAVPGVGLLVAPTNLKIVPATSSVKVIPFEEKEARVFAVIGPAVVEGERVKASAKWDGWFPAWFATDEKASKQPIGLSREQQDVSAIYARKGKFQDIKYTVSPFPYLFGWRGSTAAARYYFTRADVKLSMTVDNRPREADDGVLRLKIPRYREKNRPEPVYLRLTNANTTSVDLNCWFVNDPPKYFEVLEYTGDFMLARQSRGEPRRFGFRMNPGTPSNAEEEMTLITLDARNPVVHIILTAGD